jgi:hypothetical protein
MLSTDWLLRREGWGGSMTRKIECDGCGIQEDTYWHGDLPFRWFRLEKDQIITILGDALGPWHLHDWDCLVKFSTERSIEESRKRAKGESSQKGSEGALRRSLRGGGRGQR